MKKDDQQAEFSSKELQDKYLMAKGVSEEHLKRLDLIGMDIRRMEKFLQDSGFGEFAKNYIVAGDKKSIILSFNGKRLCCDTVNLIETKVKTRLEARPFLPDFLESIALYHAPKGERP